MIKKLAEKLKKYSGAFLCEAIDFEDNTKIVEFSHVLEPPIGGSEFPEVGDVSEFYSLIGSLTLYACPESDEAAFYIEHPSQWKSFEEGFADWVDTLGEDEQEEALPSWFGAHKVIGEIPASGNYLLLVTGKDEAGAVYEFEHDGFEFIKLGRSIEEFVLKAIDPDPDALSQIASHMRFVSSASDQQWWIKELHHDFGKVVISAD